MSPEVLILRRISPEVELEEKVYFNAPLSKKGVHIGSLGDLISYNGNLPWSLNTKAGIWKLKGERDTGRTPEKRSERKVSPRPKARSPPKKLRK